MFLQVDSVHIAPVGFEIDRIVEPAKASKADRVWLIMHSKTALDKGSEFATEIEDRLESAGVVCRQTLADRTSLFDTLRAIKEIILQEQKNNIFVNVSVGSKIQAIAATMACMMFRDISNIKPYYVVPDHYTTEIKEQETVGVKDIISLPNYRIETPSDNLVKCMQMINQSPGGKISKKQLKDLATDKKIIIVEKKDNEEQSAYMALKKNLLDPLEKKWNYIKVEKVGSRHIVSLTKEGRDALVFLGVPQNH